MPRRSVVLLSLLSLLRLPALADSGTEAVSFLDIPVGARPAALGSSYSALATDAYAPIWNPAGLGFLPSTQIAGMHLSYLETISNEFVSFVHPLGPGNAIGISGQYLSPGDSKGTDINGTPTGDFSGHFGAYSLAYGHMLGETFSLGVTGKLIDAKISDVSAQAYGFDAGALYQATPQLHLAAVVANVGTPLKFLNQEDELPGNFRIGALYQPVDAVRITAEGAYRFTGLLSGHTGVEVQPSKLISIRAGFRSDTLKGLPGLSGFTTGIGLHIWEQEFDYAWVPLGDLGDTQYFSLVLRFGGGDASKNIKNPQSASSRPVYPVYDEDEFDAGLL